jgi:hypothetical protein
MGLTAQALYTPYDKPRADTHYRDLVTPPSLAALIR